MNEKKVSSVRTEGSVVVVQDVGESQSEFVTQVAGAGEREFFPIPRDVPVAKFEKNEEEARLEIAESVRMEAACVAADLGVQSSVLCGDFSKAGGKRPIPGECAAVFADEADEYLSVVESTTPAHRGAESESP